MGDNQKFVYHLVPISEVDDGRQVELLEEDVRSTVTLNESLHDHLQVYKDKINEYYVNKLWDKYKKFANDFELVFTSCNGFPNISSHSSISRSFFKLWEILHDFEHEFRNVMTCKALRCCFLAEGPGGFIEAFAKFRQNNQDDVYHGMTLISNNKTVPSWKLPKTLANERNIKLLYGSDGTGDIYKLENIDHTLQTIGTSSCDFVTADGGFDFSNAFNKQEDMSLLLVCCEIYTALRLQKPNGIFILKIFDICNLSTIKLLNILYRCYGDVFIIKPHSSRPANSEKYIVCTGFKDVSQDLLDCLRTCIHQKITNALDFHISIQPSFLRSIVYFNSSYIIRQTFNILKTIICIDNMVSDSKNEKFVSNLKLQLEKAIRWCDQYKIPISANAIKKYRDMYF